MLRKTDLSNPGDASETNSAEGCVTTPTDTAPVPSPAMATESATPSSSMQPATATAEGTPSVSTSASSTDDSGSDDDVCFPGSVTVKLSDGSSKKMGDIIVGDIVQVAHPSSSVKDMDMYTFSPVLGFSHRLPDVIYNHFVTISASDGSSITLTSGHYMYAPDLKRARDVRTGDVLPGDRIVVDVVHGVEDKGLFNPHTETGTIVVNGMVSSCYTESVDVRTAHALLVPVRGMWKVLPKRWRDAFGLDIKDNGSVGLRALLPLIRSSKM